MKRLLTLAALAAMLLVLLLGGCSEQPVAPGNSSDNTQMVSAAADVIPGKYIVALNETPSLGKGPSAVRTTAAVLLREYGAEDDAIEHVYSHALVGFSASLSENQAKEMAADPRVSIVEPDKIVMLAPPPGKGPGGGGGGGGSTGQTTPWGVARVGGPVDGTGKTAWIIDTGIDLTHPDLNVDAARGATFVRTKDGTPNDDNGHGSHVAGTIAAIDNSIGVVGVAAGASVVPVKVLDRRGSGTVSGVIAGVDYVAANAALGDVANMSLGGGVSTTLDQAVLNASNNGIWFALAAGNDSDDANNHSPARVNGPYVVTVSAYGDGDFWAYFSNYGNPPVDFSGPGVSIESTYKNGGYNTLSGTSMATPHVAGLLLATGGHVNSDGFVSGDPDGTPDAIAHF